MTIVVQKYGGTSVADPDRIRAVADRVVRTRSQGHDVVVVVSAMGDSTDELMAMARQIAPIPNARELDLLLTAAERIAMSLLSIAINARGCPAASYTGSQAGIITDTRVVPDAGRLHAVSYEELLEMAATGARVLQTRSVEYARRSGMLLHVRSSFSDAGGTWVTEEDERMEQALISGVTHDLSEAKVTLFGVPDRPGVAATIFGAVAEEGVNVDMIVQNVSREGRTDVSFTAPKDDLAGLAEVMERVRAEIAAEGVQIDDGVGKVSLVGAGMKSHPGVAAGMFAALAAEGINIEMISTSTIRVSCVVRAADAERAVRAIHDRFELASASSVRQEH